MAARRLFIVMVVLLVVSTVIAILVPAPKPVPEISPTTGTSGATATTGASDDSGTGPDQGEAEKGEKRTIRARLGPGAGTASIEADPGDRLILAISMKRAGAIEIKGLGVLDFATPYSPARFDLLLPPRPVDYAVVALENGKVLARIRQR